jgi:hypothetical protein
MAALPHNNTSSDEIKMIRMPASEGFIIPISDFSRIVYKKTIPIKVVSNPQIRLKSKAQTDEKAQSASVLRRMSVNFEEVSNAAIGP